MNSNQIYTWVNLTLCPLKCGQAEEQSSIFLKQKTKQYTSLGYEDSEVPLKPCDHLAGLDISEYDSWKGTSMLELGLIGPHFLLSTSVKITRRSCLFLLCTWVKCTEDLSKRKTSEAEERWRRAECSPSITVPSCQAFAIWTSRVCVCWLPGLGFLCYYLTDMLLQIIAEAQ